MNFLEELNKYGQSKTPCFFLINFDREKGFVHKISDCARENIFFNFKGKSNIKPSSLSPIKVELQAFPPSFKDYKKAFDLVQEQIKAGNSYLLNLTFAVPISLKLSLEEIFYFSQAPYKLLYKNEFVVFSPEQFILIKNDHIHTFPMKGTINAEEVCAPQKLLTDSKELAEHITVVDLLRNDLGRVAYSVAVKRFRYLELIRTHQGAIYQMSSEITGQLKPGWQNRLGEILYELLPAGSVTGAPKTKTVKIIKSIENYERGFYTGIAGLFNGDEVDSAVLIRFIEKNAQGHYLYKSGGGITIYSQPQKEYEELLAKIYVPITGNNKTSLWPTPKS